MSTQTGFDLTGLSRAIQSRDCHYQLALYADAAEVEIVDAAQPEAPPQVLRGKAAIGEWLDGMSSPAVSYGLKDAAAGPDRVRYTEECHYVDGTTLSFECTAEVHRGQIIHATVTVVHVAQEPAQQEPVRPSNPVQPVRPAGRNLAGNFLG